MVFLSYLCVIGNISVLKIILYLEKRVIGGVILLATTFGMKTWTLVQFGSGTEKHEKSNVQHHMPKQVDR